MCKLKWKNRSQGKFIVFVDETNCNLFLPRREGRSRKGTRSTVRTPTSKGKNVHIIEAISQQGFVYFEKRRRRFRNDCCERLRCMLRTKIITEPHNGVVVCDSAPVHSALESRN